VSLFQGGTTIDAVYFGQSDIPLGPVTFKGATGSINTGTVTPPAHSEGDLLVLHTGHSSLTPLSAPAGWTLWKTVTQNRTDSTVSDNCSQIFYRFAPAGGVGTPAMSGFTGPGCWSCYCYSNVNQTTPFGAYAQQKEVGDTFGTKPVAPNSTMTNPHGNSLVVHAFTVMQPGSFANGISLPGGYSTMYNINAQANYSCGWYRNDRTTATINSVTMSTGSVDGGFGYTYEILPGSKQTSPLAQAVYLGSEKVWPIYVAQLSPWYSPGAALGATGVNSITVPWPFGAEFCDAVMISGGAGGNGTGIGGNPPKGGGEGKWYGITFSRITESMTFDSVRINCVANAGSDGVNGGNFNTQAANGSLLSVQPMMGTTAGGGGAGQQAYATSSNTNNRNGGNVAETFTFNGRTYTLASYGANAGRGGASSNKNGSDGSRPGGGGQSADNGGLTGYDGGKGAHGAAQLYWY